MKSFFFLSIVAVMFSCSSKKTTKDSNTVYDTAMISTKTVNLADTGLPACISKLIVQFKEEEKKDPPRKIYSYSYEGKTVYYVPAICCDFFSDLYDANCNLIAHPDGGFTGRGDGNAADFMKTRTNEKLIWKDERK